MQEEQKRIENLDLKYEFLVYYIDINRESLYERINFRVDKMMESDNMLKEVKLLFDNKENASSTCLQAIGYKEFFDYFENKASLEECIDKLKQNTRNYAKRQITWFKNKLVSKRIDGTLDVNENVNLIVNDIL